MSDYGEYAEVVPRLREKMARFEKAIDRTRSTHAGDPIDVVRGVLAAELASEGITTEAAIIEELAGQIASGP
ncbi:hypothetical protein ACIRST_33500 [Kitasatospora sp. NPDC101447]|uniref:hypothetical protein n=1 Tax=Kitasatospora sp. NPDC101447 TaxID=3364102 RepID=UPI0037FB9195